MTSCIARHYILISLDLILSYRLSIYYIGTSLYNPLDLIELPYLVIF
jgi:hypothetical protein